MKIKLRVMSPLIKLMIKHPRWLQSNIFLKVMKIFPEKISKSYDQKVILQTPDYATVLHKGLSTIKNDPKIILDLCTGTGIAAQIAAQHFPDARIIGIDQSVSMIDLAKSKIEINDPYHIEFEVGNVMKMKYPNETFDLVITSNAPIYLKELSRVLKSEGVAMIAFSFGSQIFDDLKSQIQSLLKEEGLQLAEITNVNQGVVIVAIKLPRNLMSES